eukprot:scaffold2221_cov201-Alexandrium_tamarense.AAC.5
MSETQGVSLSFSYLAYSTNGALRSMVNGRRLSAVHADRQVLKGDGGLLPLKSFDRCVTRCASIDITASAGTMTLDLTAAFSSPSPTTTYRANNDTPRLPQPSPPHPAPPLSHRCHHRPHVVLSRDTTSCTFVGVGVAKRRHV